MMAVMDFFPGKGCKQVLALTLLPVLLLSGCKKAEAPPQAPPPVPVTVAHPLQKQDMIDFDDFTARLSAVESVDIHAQVNGYLQKVNFKDGQEVKKGDLLFLIDPRPYQSIVDRLQAELERAQTNVALAENDFKRAQKLSSSNAISSEELDNRSKTLTSAQFAVKSATASLEAAKLNLDYTSVLAPIDGRLGRALVTVGNLVNGGGSTPTLLTTLVSVDPVYAYADVDEATVLKYQKLDREGLRKNNNGVISAALALGNTRAFEYEGSIDFINNTIDSGTGTLQIRAVFKNPKRELIVGQFGRLRVTASGKYTGLLIPDSALASDQDKKIVYVVTPEKTLQSREVVLGAIVDGLRVVRSGLKPEDLVVLDHLLILQPGMPVAPTEETIKAPNQNVETPAPTPAKS